MITKLIRVLIVAFALAAAAFVDLHRHAQALVPNSAASQRRFLFQDLAGDWRFESDLGDSGIIQEWFNRRLRYSIKLPGTLQSQNFGNDVSTNTPWVSTLYDRFWNLRDEYKPYTTPGKVKVPFLSQPARHYLGVAWYQRDIDIPQYMQNRRIVLTLERPHWETTVWLDSLKIGSDKSLVAPHIYDLGSITSGRHRLTIRVDNRMVLPYREDAHSVSDAVAASWNGIVGRIDLTDTGRVWIDDAQVFPDLTNKTMTIKVRVGNVTGHAGDGTITAIWPDVGIAPITWDDKGGTTEITVPIRLDAKTWSEFHPDLLPLRLWLRGQGVEDYKDLFIGLRQLKTKGRDFVLNDTPIYFRGTNNEGLFPLTGTPPTDTKSWKEIFETCKKWGLNHMRFHSWCPPEAAFDAADQVGFYLQAEPGLWNEVTPGSQIERALYDETDRMIKSYGNHPSFMLLSPSEEPRGKWKEALTKWVARYRMEDPRRLYTTGSGHTERDVETSTEGAYYLDVHRINGVMLRRESGWFGSDYREALKDVEIPVIAHEVGQWAAYPDFDVIQKFTGFMKPNAYQIFQDSFVSHGLTERNKDFAMASGRFQLDCYKEDIEANLRTPGLSGFQLMNLTDYLGQGTAPVGLLDAFGESKQYATPEEFKKFCNSTVVLARIPRRIYTDTDTFDADVEVSHFGPDALENAKVVWRIVGPKFEPKGEWRAQPIPIGKNYPIGQIHVDLSRFNTAGELKLVVTMAPAEFFNTEGKIEKREGVVEGVTYFENEWNFWVFPSGSSEPVASADCPESRVPDVLVTSEWEDAEKRLSEGGRVLFFPKSVDLAWNCPPLDTLPENWNRSVSPAWGRMLGLFIQIKFGDPKNNVLNGFPTGFYFDSQWAEVIKNVRAINLDRLPPTLEPTVWAIDDWNRNYKLGIIFECAVGDGKLLVSAIDVSNPVQSSVVALQLRRSLLAYARSDCFLPTVPVTPNSIRSFLFDTQIMRKLGASARTSYGDASSAIDGDPTTVWRAGNRNAALREPLELTIEFPQPVSIAGLLIMPRQNSREHEGDIREYAVRVSDDGNEWLDVTRGELISTFNPQRISFAKSVTARYLKLISLSGFGPDKTTALGEIAVIGPRAKAVPKK